MITITVTPQQMLDVLIYADIDVPTAKSIILDLILASDGGLKLPNDGVSSDDQSLSDTEAEAEAPTEEDTEAVELEPRKKPKRVSFSSFGGAADFKRN